MLLSNPTSCESPAFLPSHKSQLDLTSFEIVCGCDFCGATMSSIPHSMQMVKAQRKRQRNANSESHSGFYSCAEMDQPMRYNSKMMNSIWGRYNEDSVHNFKSLQCAGKVAAEFQQSQGLQIQQQQQQQMQLQPQQLMQLQQQQQQQLSQSAPESGLGLRQRLGELGQAVTTNFMDNLHQY